MFSRTSSWLFVALIIVMLSPASTVAQATFSTIHSVHFDVRYIQGVTEEDAQGILAFLNSDYDTLRNRLGLDIREKLEARLYDSPGRYRSEVGSKTEILSATYVHKILYVLTTAPPQGLEKALRYQLARAFLVQASQRSCPGWLVESFAIYHSGIMVDLSPPGSVTVASFSDLTQDLAESTSPSERNDVNFVLGRTMLFFVERYGEAKTFGVFKEFDGALSVEKVFKKVFGEDFQNIEKAWSKYVAVKPHKPK